MPQLSAAFSAFSSSQEKWATSPEDTAEYLSARIYISRHESEWPTKFYCLHFNKSSHVIYLPPLILFHYWNFHLATCLEGGAIEARYSIASDGEMGDSDIHIFGDRNRAFRLAEPLTLWLFTNTKIGNPAETHIAVGARILNGHRDSVNRHEVRYQSFPEYSLNLLNK